MDPDDWYPSGTYTDEALASRLQEDMSMMPILDADEVEIFEEKILQARTEYVIGSIVERDKMLIDSEVISTDEEQALVLQLCAC